MKQISLVLITTLLFFGCSQPDKKAELERLRTEQADLEAKIAALEAEIGEADTLNTDKELLVEVDTVDTRIFRTYVEIQGRVDAKESVDLSTEMPGTITKIHVEEGDRVKKGEILAETDARAIQQSLSEVQTNLDMARQTYQKYKNLWDQQIGTEMQLLQTKTQMEALETRFAAVQEQLRMSKIISPIDGTVDNINIKLGQAVAPGAPAIRVINFSDLKVVAEVAESYTGRIKSGNEAEVIFPDLNDSVTSKVSYASRAIDPMTRTFKVQVDLNNKKEYHPNMVARLRINDYISPKPVVVLPVKYIQKGTNESFVFVAENGRVAKRTLSIGHEYSGLAEINEGLREGDRVITGGYDLVNEGDSITTSEAIQ